MEEKLLERIKTVNEFIDLPVDDYDDKLLKTVIELLNCEELRSLGVYHIFPDPNGEFTIISTGNGYQVNITVRGEGDVECMISEIDNDIYTSTLYSESVSNVKKEIEEVVKS